MITLSPQEIVALLIEVEKADVPTDTLRTSTRKLIAEYKRLTGEEPATAQFKPMDRLEIEHINSHQQNLIHGYFALDPEGRLLGFYKGQPVIHAYTAPIRLRGEYAARQVVCVTRDGAPKSLPRQTWRDNFIPAEGIKFVEANQIIEEWLARSKTEVSA